jgi:DNA-directed RNA polymerase subunit RPC12/RpoP
MPILVSCPCGKQLRAKDEMAGKRVKCPGCGSPVVVAAVIEEVPELREVEPSEPAGRRPKVDDRSERAETPSWRVSPNLAGAQVFALSDDALFVADLDKEALGKAKKALAKGVPAEDALDETATVIPFDQMQKVQSNLNGLLVEVFWEPEEGGEKKEANLFCADKDSRDELMESLEERLGWKREVIEVGRLSASLAPLAVIGIFGFITFCFVMAATQPDSSGGGSKVVRTNFLGLIFVWIYNIFGPIGVVLLGSPFVIGGIVWLVMRLRKPPIMLTLTPRRRRGRRDD